MVDFRTFYKENANVAYMVLGYKNLQNSKEFLNNLDKTSIDILELGIAYSDPIADGEIISKAAKKALENGANINKCFEILSEVKTKKALVFMVYYNTIFSYGLKNFVKKAKSVGICALIVPDLSYEEIKHLRAECKKADISLISLISITTPKERVKMILSKASGFVYLLASFGITGGKSVDEKILKDKISEIRAYTNLPIFVGFGIKNNQDVKKMRKLADGVVVGTSIVECFEEENLQDTLDKIEEIFKK